MMVRFKLHLATRAKSECNFSQVARSEGVAYDTVGRAYRARAELIRDSRPRPLPRVLATDEAAFKKGQDYNTIESDVTGRYVLETLRGRDGDWLAVFLLTLDDDGWERKHSTSCRRGEAGVARWGRGRSDRVRSVQGCDGDSPGQQPIAVQARTACEHPRRADARLLSAGGLLWNRVDPEVLGFPFSVFVVAVLLPALIFLNAAAYVRSFWREDMEVTEGVAAAAETGARPEAVKGAERTRG